MLPPPRSNSALVQSSLVTQCRITDSSKFASKPRATHFRQWPDLGQLVDKREFAEEIHVVQQFEDRAPREFSDCLTVARLVQQSEKFAQRKTDVILLSLAYETGEADRCSVWRRLRTSTRLLGALRYLSR